MHVMKNLGRRKKCSRYTFSPPLRGSACGKPPSGVYIVLCGLWCTVPSSTYTAVPAAANTAPRVHITKLKPTLPLARRMMLGVAKILDRSEDVLVYAQYLGAQVDGPSANHLVKDKECHVPDALSKNKDKPEAEKSIERGLYQAGVSRELSCC